MSLLLSIHISLAKSFALTLFIRFVVGPCWWLPHLLLFFLSVYCLSLSLPFSCRDDLIVANDSEKLYFILVSLSLSASNTLPLSFSQRAESNKGQPVYSCMGRHC